MGAADSAHGPAHSTDPSERPQEPSVKGKGTECRLEEPPSHRQWGQALPTTPAVGRAGAVVPRFDWGPVTGTLRLTDQHSSLQEESGCWA